MYDLSLPEDIRAQAEVEFEERARAAREYGTATAEAWIKEQRLRALAESNPALPPQLTIELETIAVSLHSLSSSLVDDWVRYGWFIVKTEEHS